jgi:hypothetical protein
MSDIVINQDMIEFRKDDENIFVEHEILNHAHSVGSAVWYLFWLIEHANEQGIVKTYSDEWAGLCMEAKERTVYAWRRKLTRLGFIISEIPGQVYVISIPDGHYKIGVSNNAKERIATIQTSLPYTVSVHLVFDTDNCYEVERKLHQCFASKHVRGEWFRLTDTDLAYIRAFAIGEM